LNIAVASRFCPTQSLATRLSEIAKRLSRT
jgi:hypothetical protein